MPHRFAWLPIAAGVAAGAAAPAAVAEASPIRVGSVPRKADRLGW